MMYSDAKNTIFIHTNKQKLPFPMFPKEASYVIIWSEVCETYVTTEVPRDKAAFMLKNLKKGKFTRRSNDASNI